MKGYNIIGKEISATGTQTIKATNPRNLQDIKGEFHVATREEAELAIKKASEVAPLYRDIPAKDRATFLRTIAKNIEELSTTLVQRVHEESGLPEGRIKGERGRTCNQLRFFADIIEEGSWIHPIIDHADPNRTPRKPDIRQTLIPIGPVVVFTASNFPLAFSTAGGDTASALASGNPVIVKAHESHLGTNQMIAEAIRAAAIETGMPDGIFSSLNGSGFELGQFLVKHPKVKAVAFTGSFTGGKALYDIAQQREEPIPVFSEMGSVNPVVILPQAMEKDAIQWSNAIAGSVNLGAGQFCTNPGIIIAKQSDYLLAFKDQLVEAFHHLESATMLNKGIFRAYEKGKFERIKFSEANIAFIKVDDDENALEAHPCLLEIKAKNFLEDPLLKEEVFGPLSILVICENDQEIEEVLSSFKGQLTVSFIGDDDELTKIPQLIERGQSIAGRIIFNGLPTGVEVCHAMHHGGPFAATTDSRFTSVGGNAMYRFVRPVCFQDFPLNLLPDELKDSNPLNIHRRVNGVFGVH